MNEHRRALPTALAFANSSFDVALAVVGAVFVGSMLRVTDGGMVALFVVFVVASKVVRGLMRGAGRGDPWARGGGSGGRPGRNHP